MNIIHAGGSIDNNCYTNSREAILYNIQNNKNIIFELDVVEIKNNIFVIAHDNLEKTFYNLNKKFIDIDFNEYNSLKVLGKYTPMNFDLLNKIIKEYPKYKFILDIKATDNDYSKAISFLKNKYQNILSNIIFQVYCINDINILIKLGQKNCLLALWKYFDNNIYTLKCYEFINYAKKNKLNIIGISVRYKFYKHKDFYKIKKFGISIYLHGQQDLISEDEEKLLTKQIKFFTTRIY